MGFLKDVVDAAKDFLGGGVGDLVSGVIGGVGQQATNEANAQMAAENRAWQEYMSSTAHQREVKDLLAAGLNPILSASRGGASTPAGNVPVFINPYNSAFEGVRSWTGSRKDKADTANLDQWRKIRKPVEAVAEDADVGYKSIKAGVEGAVEAVVNKLIDVGKPDVKPLDYIRGKADEAFEGSRRVLDRVVSSAQQANVISRNQVANRSTVGGPNNWSNDHLKNLRDIRSIPDKSDRAHAMFLYNEWRRRYGK